MATTKKTTAKAAEKETAKKTTTKKAATKKAEETTEVVATEVAVKEAPAKKAPAKKTPAKKAAPKKVAPKKPAAVETKVDFFVEFGGVQVSIDEVIKNVKATYGKDAKEISVYLKPEEGKAYFVADGEAKEMDVYFC